MVTSVSVSEARAVLPSLLTRVAAGEEVTITRHGRPVAVVVRPDVLRHRRAETAIAAAAQVADLLARAGTGRLAVEPGIASDRAEELVAAMRADRDGRQRNDVDAFDADCLIYAAAAGHPLGRRVRALFPAEVSPPVPLGVGSVLLLPEVLGRPLRDGATAEVRVLAGLLSRLDLLPLDRSTADLSTVLAARYRLRALDAAHLATAVVAGADRFVTNNSRDFRSTITEIDVTYPRDLQDPTA